MYTYCRSRSTCDKIFGWWMYSTDPGHHHLRDQPVDLPLATCIWHRRTCRPPSTIVPAYLLILSPSYTLSILYILGRTMRNELAKWTELPLDENRHSAYVQDKSTTRADLMYKDTYSADSQTHDPLTQTYGGLLCGQTPAKSAPSSS